MNTLSFSRIVAGCMSWGTWGKNFSTADMAARIAGYFDLGVTTFDHADIYGNGTTEAAFGAALHACGIPRARLQLVSKCGIRFPDGRNPAGAKHYDYDAQAIETAVHNSLANLRTDYLDLLLLHRPSPLLDPEIVAPTVRGLLKQGKIRAFGVSNFPPSGLALLQAHLEVQANQIQCSLLHPEPLFDGTLDFHRQHRIATMAWAPLGGLFAKESEAAQRLRPALLHYARQYGCEPEQIALAWLGRHPANVVPVVGTTELARVKLACQAMDVALETEDWFALLEASRGHKVP